MVQETYEKYEDAMVLGKDSVPCLAPLSDSSAASSASCDESLDYSPHNKASTSEALSIPEVINEVSIDITASDNDSEDDKHVRFGSIEIRCYPVILGDHPECAAGPPVSTSSERRLRCSTLLLQRFPNLCMSVLLPRSIDYDRMGTL